MSIPVTIHLSEGEHAKLEALARARGKSSDEMIRLLISDAVGEEQRHEGFRRIVREAKPAEKPTEYGPESRYGRDSHSNGRYNEALDEYEDALLQRLDMDM